MSTAVMSNTTMYECGDHLFKGLAQNTKHDEDYEEEEGEEEEVEEEEALETEIPATTNNSPPPDIDAANTFKSPAAKGTKKRKIMDSETVQAHTMDAYKVMKTVAKRSGKDSCSVYTELLAIKLREFDEFRRAKIMNDIDNLIFHAKMDLSQPRPPAYANINTQPFSSNFNNSFMPLYVQSASPSHTSSTTSSSQNYPEYHSPQSPYFAHLSRPNF